MSKYTTTIKNLITNNFNFGLQNYPLFSNSYRDKLNDKILNHYYMSEIGFETASLFKFYLNQKMEEIMPYYNELYNIQNNILTNILYDKNITETLQRELTGSISNENESTSSNNTSANSTSNGTNSTTSSGTSKSHNTPQGSIDYQALETGKWLTDVNFNDDTSNSTSSISDTSTSESETNSNITNNSESLNTETYTKTIRGSDTSLINKLKEIRQNFINIDMLIINDLEELFFGLF